MKTLTSYIVLVALLGFAYSNAQKVVRTEDCPADPAAPINCTIHEVRVRPCREAVSGKPCRVRSGSKASISFDFTPNFSGGDLQSVVYGDTDFGIFEFPGMDSNACASTTCPAIAGTRQTYSHQLQISDTFPPGSYMVRWKLWNAENQSCCFRFQIKLYKP